MIIDKNAVITGNTDNFSEFSFDGKTVWLNGLFYLDGLHIGEESVRAFIERYYSEDFIDFNKMRGSFLLVVVSEGKITAFTDNSNMHCLYYSEDYISNSCIELADRMKADGKKLSLNDTALFQQFSYGKIFGNITYVSEIVCTDSMHYFEIGEGKLLLKEKKIGDISAPTSQSSMYDFLKNFAHSVENEKVSCALTGGYDSRMVFSVLNNEINLTCTIGGNNRKEADIRISESVAKAGKADWILVDAKRPEITEAYLKELFTLGDGMEMYIESNRLRWVQYVDHLKHNGYTVCLSGDGGVLHKDWEWKQDAPFYNRKGVNIGRYFAQRIACQQSMRDAGKRLTDLQPSQEQWFFEELEKYRKATNTQSYDMFYNYLNGNRRFEYNLCDGTHLFYAPLQEQDIVRCSYHLPRRKRAFYNQNREVISKANKEISRIPTNYGTNASERPADRLADIWNEGKYMAYRASRLIYRRFTKKTIGGQKATTWDCKEEILHCDLTEDAVKWAKANHYLAEEARIQSLSEQKAGALLYAYLWAQRIA